MLKSKPHKQTKRNDDRFVFVECSCYTTPRKLTSI